MSIMRSVTIGAFVRNSLCTQFYKSHTRQLNIFTPTYSMSQAYQVTLSHCFYLCHFYGYPTVDSYQLFDKQHQWIWSFLPA